MFGNNNGNGNFGQPPGNFPQQPQQPQGFGQQPQQGNFGGQQGYGGNFGGGSIFDQVAGAKPVTSYAPRLSDGKHKVVLKRFAPKQSDQGKGTILEADFTIGESTMIAKGETRGWAWFIQSSGWAGQYEQGRAKDFLEKVSQSLGPKADGSFRSVQEVGAELSSGKLKGLQLGCEVTKNVQRDGRTPKLDKKGRETYSATWHAIKQTAEEIAAMAAQIEKIEPQQQAAQNFGGFGGQPQQPAQNFGQQPAQQPFGGQPQQNQFGGQPQQPQQPQQNPFGQQGGNPVGQNPFVGGAPNPFGPPQGNGNNPFGGGTF